MAAVIGRLATVGTKTGGKLATKAITKKGGKGLAKSMGKATKKKGMKKLMSGKTGKLKKVAECQAKDALWSATEDKVEEVLDSRGNQGKKAIKLKSPQKYSKSPEKRTEKPHGSKKSRENSRTKSRGRSKERKSSRRALSADEDDATECAEEAGHWGRDRPSDGVRRRRSKSGDSQLKSKNRKAVWGDEECKKSHDFEEDSEKFSKKKHKEKKEVCEENHVRRQKDRQKRRDDSFVDEVEGMDASRKGSRDKMKVEHYGDDTPSDGDDAEVVNDKPAHPKKGHHTRRVKLDVLSDASDVDYETGERVSKKRTHGSSKLKEKCNLTDNDVEDEKWDRLSNRKSLKKCLSSSHSSEEELCVSLGDIRFHKRPHKRLDGEQMDEPPQMSMRELYRVIRHFSTEKGAVDVRRLTDSLIKRANLPSYRPSASSVEPKGREGLEDYKNAADDVSRGRKKSREKRKSQKGAEQRKSEKTIFGTKKTRGSKVAAPEASRGGTPVPRIETPSQRESSDEAALAAKPDRTCEDATDHDFNMMLFKMAKEHIMSEYKKKKSYEAEDNDEWLRAFEMVIKLDNAKDIRAAQLKHEEMKLESKYLKKGQVKHFQRGECGNRCCSTNDYYSNFAWAPDAGGGEGGDVGEARHRSKLDHLYDLIYALRDAPRRDRAKKTRLALPCNMDQSTASQLVPVYVPWELPQNDTYGAYYSDMYGYENQGHYQQC